MASLMALYNLSSSVVISECVFKSNYSETDGSSRTEGWTIYQVGGTLSINNSDFIDNWGYYANDGIFNNSDWSQFVDCRFIGNGYVYNSPVLYNIDTSPLIINCLFEDNRNGDDGDDAYGGLL